MPLIFLSNGIISHKLSDEINTIKSKKSGKIAIITTASQKKEKGDFAQMTLKSFLRMGYSRHQINFFDLDIEPPENLLQFEIIYIMGGNPFYLLFSIKNNQFESIFKQLIRMEALIIGASAGALVMGPSIQIVNCFTPELNQGLLTEYSALHLTDHYIFPHANRPDILGEGIETKLKSFEKRQHVKIIRLNDGEWLSI